MFDQIPAELRNAGPGVAGSLLALFFMRRPPLVLAGIFIGGCVVSFYVTPWLVHYFDMERGRDTLGFIIGLFGMATTAKIFDTIEAVNATDLWKAVVDVIRKRLGA